MRPFSSHALRALRPLSAKPTSSLTSTRLLSTKLTGPRSLTRITIPSIQPRFVLLPATRQHSTSPLTSDPKQPETEEEREQQNEERRKNEEAYKISFTCKPCGERSTHRMSKQGYHRGTVLIQCPSCQNRHVISDHLGIFFDKGTTLEDLLKEKGQAVTHGVTDGDMEFWDDGTVKTFPHKPKTESS
ncbi:hypothetical protein N7478_002341 [Penicillium angulare]|uniref:uncharacterized protein n=1 Tax=Penicillium angulare TaxID=116970 RepID=UPI00253F67FE|nr:uncharacterized protein N7478_002341 [Penicillium angulare]KAJ5286655.1 hypothetical protein N7478_002341 [Penicillium angulare]